MGVDGGVKITKISDIKKNWINIKNSFIKWLGSENKTDWSDISNKDVQEAMKLPDNIDKYSGDEICKMLEYFKSCDCPYNLDDIYIITGDGDYVSSTMRILSDCLNGEYVETWT